MRLARRSKKGTKVGPRGFGESDSDEASDEETKVGLSPLSVQAEPAQASENVPIYVFFLSELRDEPHIEYEIEVKKGSDGIPDDITRYERRNLVRWRSLYQADMAVSDKYRIMVGGRQENGRGFLGNFIRRDRHLDAKERFIIVRDDFIEPPTWPTNNNRSCQLHDLVKIREFLFGFAALTSIERYVVELLPLLKEFFPALTCKGLIDCGNDVCQMEEVSNQSEGMARALLYFEIMKDAPLGVRLSNLASIFTQSRLEAIRGSNFLPSIQEVMFRAFSESRDQLAGLQRAWCFTMISIVKNHKFRQQLLGWARGATQSIEDVLDPQEAEIAMKLDSKLIPCLCASLQIGHSLFQRLPDREDQKDCYTKLAQLLDTVQHNHLLGRATSESYIREWVTYLAHFDRNPRFSFSFQHHALSNIKVEEVLEQMPLASLSLSVLEVLAADIVKFIQVKWKPEGRDYSKRMLELMSHRALTEPFIKCLHIHMPQNRSGMDYRICMLAEGKSPRLVQELESTKLEATVKKFDPEVCQELIDYVLKKKLFSLPARDEVARVFSAAWQRIFDHVAQVKPDQFKNAEQIGYDLYAVLESDGATNLISNLLKIEPKSMPLPFSVAEGVVAAATDFCDKLQSGEVLLSTLEICESRSHLLLRLSLLCPTLPRDALTNLREKIEQAQNTWDHLLVSLESMLKRPRFGRAAVPVHAEYVHLHKQNLSCLIKDWTVPSLGTGLCRVSKLLASSLKSKFFCIFWNESSQTSDEKEIPEGTPVDELVTAWTEEVHNQMNCWQKFIESIKDETLTYGMATRMLSNFISTASLANDLGQIGGVGEAEIREVAMKYFAARRKELEDLLSIELSLAARVLRVECKDQSMTVGLLLTVVEMLRFVPDAIALRKIALSSGCPVCPSHSLAQFCKNFERGDTDISLKVALESFNKFHQSSDAIQHLICGFPQLYLQVMEEEKLLELLALYRNIQVLNQKIDNKQGDDIQDTDGALLSALRAAAPVFLIPQGGALLDSTRKCEVTFEYVLRYVSLTGSSIPHLYTLRGNVAAVASLLKQDEDRKIIADVKSILSKDGSFQLKVTSGVVTLSANMMLEQQLRTISAAEFETLPSHLLLTSGVVGTADSISDEDADRSLPANINSTEDREVYVMRFIKVHDVLEIIASAIKELSNAGHPDFQQQCMRIPGEARIPALRKMAANFQAVLRNWLAAFTTYRQRHPMLSMLSRRQLVACLSALRQNSLGPLQHTLLSIGCPPKRLSTLAENIGAVAGSNKAPELVATVARLPEEYLVPEQWASQRTNLAHSASVSHITTELGMYKLITVPDIFCPSVTQEQPISAPLLEEVVVGMFVARHSRFPTPVEWLNSTPDTSCIDVEDFLCRWYNWQTLPKPWKDCRATFVILHVSELSYAVQTHLVWKLREFVRSLTPRANELRAPLLLFSAAASGSYSVANALAKDELVLQPDVVRELRNLFGAFAKERLPVYCAHSGAGKTESIIRAMSQKQIPHVQLSVDVAPFEQVLKRFDEARAGQRTVLHFNVGHRGNAREIGAALIQYIFVGCWRDKSGFVHPRHVEDIIVIELSNTGLADERDRFPFMKHFPVIPLIKGISLQTFEPKVCGDSDSILYRFEAEENKSWVLGAKMFCALKKSIDEAQTLLPHHAEIPEMPTPNPVQVMSALDTVLAKLAEDREHKNEIDIVQKRRIFHFAATQLANLHHAFDWDQGEDDFYRHIAFHYSMISVLSSSNLSTPSMRPLSPSFQDDDIKRCVAMVQFSAWRQTPFVICSPSSFSTVSLDGKFDIFKYIAKREPNYRAELLETSQLLAPYNRDRLHELCQSLRTPYKSDHRKPAIGELVQLLNANPKINVVLSAMETLTENKFNGTDLVEDVAAQFENVRNATTFLNSIPGANPGRNAMVSGLKHDAERFIQSLTCKNPDDPSSAFTITPDIILRLIAIHLKLLSGIPVVIMGEQGCGKTETLSFYSRISGNEFEVINVQEGMTEEHFYDCLRPVIAKAAVLAPLRKSMVVMLDEVNTTSFLWTAKDILCDKIVCGHRLPANLGFVAIMNPWKLRTEAQRRAIDRMDVGGLDFSKYNKQASAEGQPQLQLVYRVHRAPETLYSLVWDFGYSASIKTPLSSKLRASLSRDIRLRSELQEVTDEFLLATHMLDSLWGRISEVMSQILNDFINAGDSTAGTQYRVCLRTVLVELLLDSQKYLREEVYAGEVSVVSLRDMRRACNLVPLVLWFLQVQFQDDPKKWERPLPHFHALTMAVHIALVNTYCLRLDSVHRLKYLVRIQNKWAIERHEFQNLHSDFLPAPTAEPVNYEHSLLYKSFDELAEYFVSRMKGEQGIVANQALKENMFGMIVAVCTKSALFIVGRPGSTKSWALQLLSASSQAQVEFENSFLGRCLQSSTQKFVIQCSPDTTAWHVNQRALRAATTQLTHNRANIKTSSILVLEEVGATIGSSHNPLMAMHGMIDHGVQVVTKEGAKKYVHNPIIGISNYHLDSSKMGRGHVIYRGNPTDLDDTARRILLSQGGPNQNVRWVGDFASSFSNNILQDDSVAYYYGMRDFYAIIITVKYLSQSCLPALPGSRAPLSEIHAHTVRWALLINLHGLPEVEKEQKISEAMLLSFASVQTSPAAVCEWQEDATNKVRLCDVCLRMRVNVALLNLSPELDPNEKLQTIFRERCKLLNSSQYPCEQFLHSKDDNPAPEIVAYSLREHSARHMMVFTKANAALKILRSSQLIRDERVTAVFHSPKLTTTELARDMMRVKAALREGHILVLVQSRHLYEALLDALNVNYIKEETGEGTLHRTMLSMAGVTQSVFVRPSFRCIVIEDQDEARTCILPPFMNRFLKATLTYGSVLNRDQRAMRDQILVEAELRVDDKSLNLLRLLIPGYTMHTLDSIAYEPDMKGSEMRRRMGICFSPKALRRLELGLIENLPTAEVNILLSSWKRARARCLDYTEVIQGVLDDQKEPTHAMIFTEQIELDSRELVKKLGEAFQGESKKDIRLFPSTPLQLNQANIADLHNALSQLRSGKLAENEAGLCICTLDVSAGATGQTISFDAFMYAVSQLQCSVESHVVLIVIVDDPIKLSPGNENNSQFQLTFERNWVQIFADEVVPIDPHLGSLEFLENPLGEVLTEELISQLLLRDDNLIWISQLTSHMTSQTQDTKKLLGDVFSRPSLARKAICGIIQKGLKSANHSVEDWTRLALLSARPSAFSLRSIYLDFLGAVVARAFLAFAPDLMSFGNLKLACDPNDNIQELFATICCDPAVVPLPDCSKCFRFNQFPVVYWQPVEIAPDFVFDLQCEVTFPFAPYLARALHLEGKTDGPIAACYKGKLPKLLLRKYVIDVFCLGLGIPSYCVRFVTELFTRYKNFPLQHAVDVHVMLTENWAWMQALKMIIEVPSPLQLDEFVRNGHFEPSAIYHLFAVRGIIPLQHLENVEIVCDHSPTIPWSAANASALAFTHVVQDNKQSCEFLELAMQKFFESPILGLKTVLYEAAGQEFAKYFLFALFPSNRQGRAEYVIQLLDEFPANIDPSAQMQCSIGFLVRMAMKFAILEATQPIEKDLIQCVERFASRFSNLVIHNVVDVLRSPDCIVRVLSLERNISSRLVSNGALIAGLMLICETLLAKQTSSEQTAKMSRLSENLENFLSGSSDTLRNYALMFALRQLSCGGSGDVDAALKLVRSSLIPESIRLQRKIDNLLRSRKPVSILAAIPYFSLALDELCNLNAESDLQGFRQFPAMARTGAIGAVLLRVDLPKNVELQSLLIIKVIDDLPEGSWKLMQALLEPPPQLMAWSDELRRLFLHLSLEMDYSACAVMKMFQRLAEQTAQHRENLREIQKEIEEALVPRCPRCRQAFVDWTDCFAVTCSCGCAFCGYCLKDCGTDAHPHITEDHKLPFFAEPAVFNRLFGASAKENIRKILDRVPAEVRSLLDIGQILQGNPFFVIEADFLPPNPREVRSSPATTEWMDVLSAVSEARVRVLDEKSSGPDWVEITNKLNRSLANANELLFPGTPTLTPIMKWMHATVRLVFYENVGQVALDRQKLRAMVSERLRHEQSELLKQFDHCCKKTTSELNEELTFSSDFQLSLEKQIWDEARAFLYRSRLSEAQVINHIVQRDDFKVLNKVIALQASLAPECVERARRVARYVGLLHDFAQKDAISRAQAEEEGSLMKLVHMHPELMRDFDEFQDAFKLLFPLVSAWQCGQASIQTTFKDFAEGFSDLTPLNCLLPAERGPGILPCAMYAGRGEEKWLGLALAHNSLVMEIHGSEYNQSKPLNPYKLAPTDVAAINLEEIMTLVLDLFTVPNYKPTFSHDFAILESQCIYGPLRWHKYHRIADELPPHTYGVDMNSLFSRVQQNLELLNRPFELLTSPQYNTLKCILTQNAQLVESIFDYCALLFLVLDGLLTQSANATVSIPELASQLRYDTPMTKSQQRGQAFLMRDAPIFSQTLKLTQIPCLMGMCWNRVTDKCVAVPLEFSQEQEVQDTLKKLLNHPTFRMDIPLLLSSMRLLGIAVLSTERTEAFLESGLLPSLQAISAFPIPFLDGDDVKNDQFIDSPPFTTPLKHFRAVVALMEQELKGEEENLMAAGGEKSDTFFSVSFATVRHLLVGTLTPQEHKEESKREEPAPQEQHAEVNEVQGNHAVTVHTNPVSLTLGPSWDEDTFGMLEL